MKKLFAFFLLFALLFTLATVHATAPRLVDDADLLTDYEESAIVAKLDEISARYNADIVIVTTDSLGGKTAEAYADDYYDYHDYREDAGVLLLISMEPDNHYVHISTSGTCITALNDAGIDHVLDVITGDLSDGDFADACIAFTGEIDKCMSAYNAGETYPPHEPLGIGAILACGIIAFLFGLAVIGSMKKKMKSVAYQRAASQYVVPGSLNVAQAQDFFLYRTVTRVARPKESSSGGSSTHTSSSGHSHGGGGRSF